MRIAALALCLAGAVAGEASAQAERRALERDEAAGYAAVGRLNIAGSRFCTATLVEARQVLTAAHCLFHPRTGEAVPLGDLRFSPGPEPGRRGGVRVVGAAMAPGFALVETPGAEDLRNDIALLELEEAIEAAPFAVAALLQGEPAPRIVSFAKDRPRRPSINEACPPLGMIEEVLVIACAIERGVSGAPVLAGEGSQTRVVAVVSSMGRMPDGGAFALAVATAPWIEALREQLAGGDPP